MEQEERSHLPQQLFVALARLNQERIAFGKRAATVPRETPRPRAREGKTWGVRSVNALEVDAEPKLLPALVEGGQRLCEAGRLQTAGVVDEVVGIQRVEHLPESCDAERADPDDLAHAHIHRALAVAPPRVARFRPVLERVGVELKPG